MIEVRCPGCGWLLDEPIPLPADTVYLGGRELTAPPEVAVGCGGCGATVFVEPLMPRSARVPPRGA